MSIKSILLHAASENINLNSGPAAYALGLAQQFEAHLTGFVFEVDIYIPMSSKGESLSAGIRAKIRTRNAAAIEAAEDIRKTATGLALSHEIIVDRLQTDEIRKHIVDYARIHDVSVLGFDDTVLIGEREIVEYLLFQSGRPLIIVPKAYAKPFSCDNIVVAWDYTRNAARALADAMPLLEQAKSVTLVSFVDDKKMKSKITSKQLVAALESRGIAAKFKTANRGDVYIHEAMLGFAKRNAADLLVMGGYGHSRFREYFFGGATEGILDSADIPVLMAH